MGPATRFRLPAASSCSATSGSRSRASARPSDIILQIRRRSKASAIAMRRWAASILPQSSYESALALAPHDPRLLLALADVLDHQGQAERAADTRAEARSVSRPVATAAHPLAPTEQGVAIPIASIGSVTVKLPPAHPAPQLEPRRVALAQPVLNQPAAVETSVPRPIADAAVPVALPAARVAAKLDRRPVPTSAGDWTD